MKRNLQSVATFAPNSPFSENQLRWMIFNASTNGLREANALVRVRRRVYIDVDAFDVWIESQNAQAAA
ncbi:MAG: DNA-binding protein [Dokdonella sp.]